MREITDKILIDKLIKSHSITTHLQSLGLVFKLYEYDVGEILYQTIEEKVLIKFLVAGSISIYSIRYDGSRYPIRYIDEFTMLGDIELSNTGKSHLLTEAKSSVLCLTLQLDENKELLMNDNTFLTFVINSLSQKLVRFSEYESKFNTFEERFLDYIQNECEDNKITSVENTLFQLRCSRRQLQRVLKKLVETNVIQKTGKGCYRLIKCIT